MGNAVMDIEWNIPFSFLSEQNMEKGFMTLVEQGRQEELLQYANNPYQHCGGSAANTLLAMAHLGSKTFFNCKVAQDPMGELYLHNLKQYGVEYLLPADDRGKDPLLPTATCLVLITPDGERTMQTHLGIASELSPEDIRLEYLAASRYLYIEGYLASSPQGGRAAVKAVELARAHGVKTVLSLSDPSMAKYFRPQLLEIIGEQKIDFLFCNAEEALLFTEQKDFSRALDDLSSLAAGMAITRGADGVVIREKEREWSLSAPKVEAVNTNGAGDLFAGTFLHAWLEGCSASHAGTFACEAAARLVTRPGSRLEKDELRGIHTHFFRK